MICRHIGNGAHVALLVVLLSACVPVTGDEEPSSSEMIITPPRVVVGPWVTCVERPLCSEYLTRNGQAWDDIYFSCQASSDGQTCPPELRGRACIIEYRDGGVEKRRLFADSAAVSAVEFLRLCHRLGGR